MIHRLPIDDCFEPQPQSGFATVSQGRSVRRSLPAVVRGTLAAKTTSQGTLSRARLLRRYPSTSSSAEAGAGPGDDDGLQALPELGLVHAGDRGSAMSRCPTSSPRSRPATRSPRRR